MFFYKKTFFSVKNSHHKTDKKNMLKTLIHFLHSFWKPLKRKPLQKGQAVVEYVLLLVVVLFIIIGLRESFFKPFNDWTTNLYGSNGYFSCFLQSATLIGMPSPCNPFPTPQIQDRFGNFNTSSYTPSPYDPPPPYIPPPYIPPPYTPPTTTNNPPYIPPSPPNSGGEGSSWGNSRSSDNKPNGALASNSSDLGRSSKFPVSSSRSYLQDDYLSKGNNKKQKRKFTSRNKKKRKGNSLDPPEYIFIEEGNGGRQQRRKSLFFQVNSVEEEEENSKALIATTDSSKENMKNKKDQKTNFIKKRTQTTLASEKEKPITFGAFVKYIFIFIIIATILVFITMQMKQVYENIKAA